MKLTPPGPFCNEIITRAGWRAFHRWERKKQAWDSFAECARVAKQAKSDPIAKPARRGA